MKGISLSDLVSMGRKAMLSRLKNNSADDNLFDLMRALDIIISISITQQTREERERYKQEKERKEIKRKE